jgi:hypothetical protein
MVAQTLSQLEHTRVGAPGYRAVADEDLHVKLEQPTSIGIIKRPNGSRTRVSPPRAVGIEIPGNLLD